MTVLLVGVLAATLYYSGRSLVEMQRDTNGNAIANFSGLSNLGDEIMGKSQLAQVMASNVKKRLYVGVFVFSVFWTSKFVTELYNALGRSDTVTEVTVTTRRVYPPGFLEYADERMFDIQPPVLYISSLVTTGGNKLE
ncbi:hypothetical protein MSG28_006416 [Choristoneura fumiferana]|uniref:Uncharacterized protein n=1 Tax=Choristoneura fumiferana TaxID=7141 RepID=A0ACC0JEU4_CHOFU|nr:hypothetical protein MSG28_006416 [Choristoneura fumiferana]